MSSDFINIPNTKKLTALRAANIMIVKNPQGEDAMKITYKRIISLIVAAAFIFSAAAVSADARAPEGYNDHDYQKIAAFLEIEDEYGVKNGMKLTTAYDPLDPESWNAGHEDAPRIEWTEAGGEMRLMRVNCPSVPSRLFGSLDLDGCAALEYVDVGDSAIESVDAGGCALLDTLICKNNQLTSIDVSGCSSLRLLNCANNQLAALSVSDCPSLRFLECRWNRITSLNTSANPLLSVLICTDNCLKTLDLSANPLLGCVSFLRMVDGGGQYISCFIARDPEYSPINEFFISADCYDSCGSFAGWFTADGRFLWGHTTYVPQPEDGGVFVARFEIIGPMPGDADGDGEVTATDALLILRASMSIISGNTGCGYDVNGDGSVELTDALLVLRRVMGLFG